MKLDEMRELFKKFGNPESIQEQEEFYARMRAEGIVPGEFYQEMEMDSRYVDTHRDVSYSNADIHLHSHGFYELLCCRNTCGVEYLVGSRRYRLQKGDIIFVSPGVSHRPILPKHMTEPYERDVLWISKEFAQLLREDVSGFAQWEPSGSNLMRTAGTQWEFLTEMFREGVLEAEERQIGWEAAVAGNTLLLMANLWRALRLQTARPLKAEKPELLDRVVAYIEAHLAEKISLGETAKHFYVSESSISHLFQQKMGVSFYRYVTQRRLISAKELISLEHPLELVAENVGFTDYSTFYRAFKREYGISPSQFARLQREGEAVTR